MPPKTVLLDNRSVPFPPLRDCQEHGVKGLYRFVWLWRTQVTAPITDADSYQALWTTPDEECWMVGHGWQYQSAGQNTELTRIEPIHYYKSKYFLGGAWYDLPHFRGEGDYSEITGNWVKRATGNKNGDIELWAHGVTWNSIRGILSPHTDFITEVKIHLAAAEWLAGDNINQYFEIYRARREDMLGIMKAKDGYAW